MLEALTYVLDPFLVLGCVFEPQILSILRGIISRESGREISKLWMLEALIIDPVRSKPTFYFPYSNTLTYAL